MNTFTHSRSGGPLPPGSKIKVLATREAHKLAELCVLRDVLQSAFDSLTIYYDKFIDIQPGSPDHPIRMSLFRDGIVQFASCFTAKENDKDERLRAKDVFGHLPYWDRYTKWLHEIRDSFAAHSFGAHRQYEVCAIMEPNETRTRFRYCGIAEMSLLYGGNDATEKDRMLSYVSTAQAHVAKKLQRAEEDLRAILRTADPNELLRLPDFKLAAPTADEAKLSRGQFRKRGKGLPVQVPEGLWSQTSATETSPPQGSDQQRGRPDEESPPPTPESS